MVDTKGAFGSDIVLKVRPPAVAEEVPLLKDGANLVSYIQPAINKTLVEELQKKKMTVVGANTARSTRAWHACGWVATRVQAPQHW